MSQVQQSNSQSPPLSGADGQYLPSYHGTGGELFWLLFKNGFLVTITFGFYFFWAISDIRKYFLSRVELDGQRLEYHGTGLELFIGYLKIVGVYLLFGAIVAGAFQIHPYFGLAVAAVEAVILAIAIPYAQYSGKRYRASRTQWRGVRFGMQNKGLDYAKLFFKEVFLTGLTLGLWFPIAVNRLIGFRINHTFWGELNLRYTAEDKEMWKMCFKGGLLCAITLGFYTPWFILGLKRHRAQHTWIGSSHHGAAHGDLTHGVWSFVWATIKLYLFTLFTLGIGAPWAFSSFLRFLASGIKLQGKVNFADVKPVASEGNAVGDMLDAA